METQVQRPSVHHDCDVLVIGAGVSGYCAAIQAGRRGRRTVLLEKDAVLGGNAGPNLGVGITGAERYNPYGVESGIIQQLREAASWVDARTHTDTGSMGYTISRRFEAVVQGSLADAGVRVLKRHYACAPILENGRITGVLAEDTGAFRPVRINVAGCVIEASGDGEIGALAGADFDYGTEGADEFGERSAPPKRLPLVQGTSLVAIAHNTGREVVYVPPADTPQFTPRVWHSRMASFLRHHDGWFSPDRNLFFLYVTETGGHMDTIREDGEIYELLLKQLWAEWDHIKNGPHSEQARCWDILWVSPKAGKRESRRFLGDYVLTQTDVEQGRRFEDDVAYGGHDLDDHRPLGTGSNIYAYSIPPMYGIPLRCCYSRNVANLLVAGRLISATHLAHSSTRIMGTGAAIGQAVGMAAALCGEHDCSPAELAQSHIDELQRELLAADATLLGQACPAGDDLARRSTVRASSEARFNAQSPGQFVPLIAPAGVILWDWPARLGTVELYLRSESAHEEPLRLQVLRTKREPRWKTVDEFHQVGWGDMSDRALKPMGSASSTLPAGFEGWLAFDLRQVQVGPKDPASDDDRLFLTVNENPRISWALRDEGCEIGQMVEHSHHSPGWTSMGCMAAVRMDPAPAIGEAANAVNGYHRRFSTAPTNMWISDPTHELPQELELAWEAPVTIGRVSVTFDTLCRDSRQHPWHSGARVCETLVRDYDVSALTQTGWVDLVRIRDNFRRRRDHEFAPMNALKLRVRVLAVHGEGVQARLYQVSAHSR